MSKKTQSPKSARDRMRAERAKRAEQDRRRDRMLRIGIAALVVVIIAAIGVAVQWQRASIDTTASYPQGVALGYKNDNGKPVTGNPGHGAGMGNGIGRGDKDAPVVIETFVDFACPHCQKFESEAGSTLDSYVKQGKARVVTYPVTLNEFGRPTELAANAYACAVNESGAKGAKYFNALYANYSQSWTNAQLTDLGDQVGVSSGKFHNCVKSDAFAEWVRSMDQTATDRGMQGTPTVFVNGKQLDLQDTTVDGLKVAVSQALQKSGKSRD